MNLPLQESFFRWPTSVKALVDCIGRNLKKFTSCRHRESFTENSYKSIATLISFLLLAGSPSAIIFVVPFIIIYSIKAATFRPIAHVFKEVSKNFPSWVDGKASLTVVFRVMAMFSSAPTPKLHPGIPFRGISSAMLRVCYPCGFRGFNSSSTPTAITLSLGNISNNNPTLDPAYTSVKSPSFYGFFWKKSPEAFHRARLGMRLLGGNCT